MPAIKFPDESCSDDALSDDAECADKGYPEIFHCNQGRCEHGL